MFMRFADPSPRPMERGPRPVNGRLIKRWTMTLLTRIFQLQTPCDTEHAATMALPRHVRARGRGLEELGQACDHLGEARIVGAGRRFDPMLTDGDHPRLDRDGEVQEL